MLGLTRLRVNLNCGDASRPQCLLLNPVDLADLEVDQGGMTKLTNISVRVKFAERNMTKSSAVTRAGAKDKGDRTRAAEILALTKGLQRLHREFDRVSSRIPFHPSDSMLFPDPNQWRPTDLKD